MTDPVEPASVAPVAAPVARDEEKWNAATHALGMAFALVGGFVVVYTAVGHSAGAARVAACAVYAATLVAVYTASTLSHVFRDERARRTFRIADQAVIFLFIAGSYTPMAVAWLGGGSWWLLHAFVWGAALAGFASKAVFAHRVHLGTVSTALYVVLGWSGVPMLVAVPGPLARGCWAAARATRPGWSSSTTTTASRTSTPPGTCSSSRVARATTPASCCIARGARVAIRLRNRVRA